MSQLIHPLQVLERFAPHDFSVFDFFTKRVHTLGSAPMVEFENTVLSWNECAVWVDKASAWLLDQGVRQGDRIGLMSYNHPSTVVLFIACSKLGVMLVPCNPDFAASEAKYIFEHAQVCAVICSSEIKDKVVEATQHMPKQPWVACNDQGTQAHPTGIQDVWQNYEPMTHLPLGRAESTCLIIYTSGTTGFPKGVMHSQRSYLLTGEAFVQRMFLQAEDRLMCVLPLFHINALMYSLGGSMACGGTLILIKKFSASQFWHQATQSRATEVNVIMSAAAILARRPSSEFNQAHCIKKMFLAPLNQDLKDTFQERFGVETLIECYGMTEIPGVLSNPFLGPHKIGSMGMISAHPSPQIERPQVIILNEDGHETPLGEVGEIAVKTPTIMQGYYKDPEQTEKSFSKGWFLTGDLGFKDKDDFYFFFTRKKDIIRRKGENLSGAEIDNAISSHPDVSECAAIGVPSDLGDEEVLIAVVPRTGSSPTPQDIMTHARAHLSALKLPRYIVMVESLPHTGSMKIAKFKLKPATKLLELATDFSTP